MWVNPDSWRMFLVVHDSDTDTSTLLSISIFNNFIAVDSERQLTAPAGILVDKMSSFYTSGMVDENALFMCSSAEDGYNSAMITFDNWNWDWMADVESLEFSKSSTSGQKCFSTEAVSATASWDVFQKSSDGSIYLYFSDYDNDEVTQY
jgi:hypothetical protein